MAKFEITDEMVALEVQRLTNGAIDPGSARKFAADLRQHALYSIEKIDYSLAFDKFVDQYVRPRLPTNGVSPVTRIGGGQEPIKQVRKNHWHAFVATPAYDNRVYTQFAQALADSAFRCPLYEVLLTAVMMANGCFIDLARNIFVRIFLEEFPDCTHLFFIDADLKWSPKAFIGLVRADLPICAGVYPRRQTDESYPVHFAEHPDEGGLWVETIDGFDWFMANRVPTGFLCIRRDVVEEMAADADQLDIFGQPSPVPELFFTSHDTNDVRWPGTRRYVGEDYGFCDNYVKKYGKPIHVWPDIDFEHGSQQIGVKGNLLEWVAKDVEKQAEKQAQAEAHAAPAESIEVH